MLNDQVVDLFLIIQLVRFYCDFFFDLFLIIYVFLVDGKYSNINPQGDCTTLQKIFSSHQFKV